VPRSPDRTVKKHKVDTDDYSASNGEAYDQSRRRNQPVINQPFSNLLGFFTGHLLEFIIILWQRHLLPLFCFAISIQVLLFKGRL
jgi:hypothetical protein